MDHSKTVDRARELADKNLAECVEEILEWRKTGILRDGKVREIEAICEEFDQFSSTRMAEDFVVTAALHRLADAPAHNSLKETINDLPQLRQRQDAMNDQLSDLRYVANRLGMYDAADFIRDLLT